jgi:hypothetical protein
LVQDLAGQDCASAMHRFPVICDLRGAGTINRSRWLTLPTGGLLSRVFDSLVDEK